MTPPLTLSDRIRRFIHRGARFFLKTKSGGKLNICVAASYVLTSVGRGTLHPTEIRIAETALTTLFLSVIAEELTKSASRTLSNPVDVYSYEMRVLSRLEQLLIPPSASPTREKAADALLIPVGAVWISIQHSPWPDYIAFTVVVIISVSAVVVPTRLWELFMSVAMLLYVLVFISVTILDNYLDTPRRR